MTVHPNRFANQIELHRYAELNGLAYAWAYTRAFDRWKQLLTQGEYELVDVRTSQGTIRAMLFQRSRAQSRRWPLRASTGELSNGSEQAPRHEGLASGRSASVYRACTASGEKWT
jgi:hypothetical protein